MKKAKHGDIKISTSLFILLIIFAAFLMILSFQKAPNVVIIGIFSDIMKGLAGALIGAIAGERR